MLIHALVIACAAVFWWVLALVLSKVAWVEWAHLGVEALDEVNIKIGKCMLGGMVISLALYFAYHVKVQRAVGRWVL